MDEILPNSVSSWLSCVFNVIGTVGVIVYATPIFAAVIVPIGIVYFFAQVCWFYIECLLGLWWINWNGWDKIKVRPLSTISLSCSGFMSRPLDNWSVSNLWHGHLSILILVRPFPVCLWYVLSNTIEDLFFNLRKKLIWTRNATIPTLCRTGISLTVKIIN